MKTVNTSAPNYTAPNIVKSGNDWYVFFRYNHGGKRHPLKYREGLNRITNLKERQRQFEALLEVRTEWLAAGWNPVIDPDFKARNVTNVTDAKKMSLNEALDFAYKLKAKDLSKKSRQDYNNILQIVKNHADETGHGILQIDKVNRLHIIELLEHIRDARKWSNHRYNMYLGCLSSMFTMLEKALVIEYNPASKIDKKKVAESNKFAPYTEDEKEQISEFLYTRHYRLFVFLQFEYHTGIRPKELLAMQINQIDVKRRVITLVPDLDEETTKTPFVRPVVIPDELMPYIKEMGLEQFDKDFYVFGSPFMPGEGNRGAGSQKWGAKMKRLGVASSSHGRTGAMRLDFLMPSPYRADRDTVTKLWKKLVIDELGVNKHLYAGKHTGTDDKILAGIPLDALRTQYGHRNKRMTERYAHALIEVSASQIRTQAPAFTKQKKTTVSRMKKAA